MGRFLDSLSRRPFLSLGLACSTLFFLPLGLRALWDPYEARVAEIAREMLELNNWVTPHLHYTPVLKDPPLMYWLTAISLGIGGAGVMAARFWCAVFGLLTVWVTYRLGKNWKGERTGLLAAVILATSLGFFAYTQLLTLDMAFTFWATLALLAGSGLLVERSAPRGRHGDQARRLAFLLAFAAAGGILTKGFVALGLPAAALGVVAAAQGRRLAISKIPWKAAFLLCAALAFPWFVRVGLQNPSFPYHFLASHPFSWDASQPGAPFYYFLPVLLAGFLPWIVFLPKTAATWLTHRRAVLQRDPEGALLMVWACLVFVFYSLAHVKNPAMILPIFPALALLVAGEFDEALDEEGEGKMPGWVGAGLAVLVLIFFLGLVFLKVQPAMLSMGSPEWKAIFEQGDTLALGLGLGIFVIVGAWGMRQTLACLGGVMLVQVLFLTSVASLAPELDAYRSSLQITQILRTRAAQGDLLMIHGLEDRVPSLDYYLRRSYLFQTSESPQDLMSLSPGTWAITDFAHWQVVRQSTPPNTFQMVNQTGSLVLFRKEK